MNESNGISVDDSSAYNRNGTLLNMIDTDWVENIAFMFGVDDSAYALMHTPSVTIGKILRKHIS